MRVFVAGHRGMVGRALMRQLEADTAVETLTQSRANLDLTDQAAVHAMLREERPDLVIVAAAKVGGIVANSNLPAEFLYDNLMIEANLIHGAFAAGIGRLIFLGSSCIYPRETAQPIVEEALMTGPLEPTNAPYAVAKIAGVEMCAAYSRQYGVDFRALMPTNLYGPGDNFHPTHSHVLPALLSRFHAAARARLPEVTVWGSGRPRREFLHVDDLAHAILFIANLGEARFAAALPDGMRHLNVGTGCDLPISDLAAAIAEVTGYRGRIRFDPSKPDGTPRKVLDVRRITGLGWTAEIPFGSGLAATYSWYVDQAASELRSA
ncbi:MAG: GDP-L-fucose synthase [Pseudomonadota bacterium]